MIHPAFIRQIADVSVYSFALSSSSIPLLPTSRTRMTGGRETGMNGNVETNENSWNERRFLGIVDSTSRRIGLDLGGVGTRRHR